MIYRVTTNDNKWYREWQLGTTSGAISHNEWEQVTTSQSEWQRVVILDKVLFASNALGMSILKTKRLLLITPEVNVVSSCRCS